MPLPIVPNLEIGINPTTSALFDFSERVRSAYIQLFAVLIDSETQDHSENDAHEAA